MVRVDVTRIMVLTELHLPTFVKWPFAGTTSYTLRSSRPWPRSSVTLRSAGLLPIGIVKRHAAVLEPRLLVLLDRYHKVRVPLLDRVHDLRVATTSVEGDGGTREVEGLEESRNRRDLVGLLVGLELTEDEAVRRRKCADHVHKRHLVVWATSSASRLAIDGNDTFAPTHCLHPAAEHVLERIRGHESHHPANRVMARCPVLVWHELPESFEFLHTESADAREIVEPRQRGRDDEKADFRERIVSLGLLTRVGYARKELKVLVFGLGRSERLGCLGAPLGHGDDKIMPGTHAHA